MYVIIKTQNNSRLTKNIKCIKNTKNSSTCKITLSVSRYLSYTAKVLQYIFSFIAFEWSIKNAMEFIPGLQYREKKIGLLVIH